MVKKVRLVDSNYIPKPTVIELILRYAVSQGYTRKEGSFYDQKGNYIGGLYQLGRMGNIDMQEFK